MTSKDGYLSLVTFDKGELGEILGVDKSEVLRVNREEGESLLKVERGAKEKEKEKEKEKVKLPPLEGGTSVGETVLVAPASKKMKFVDTREVAESVAEVAVGEGETKKTGTKRRIAPTLMAASSPKKTDENERVVDSIQIQKLDVNNENSPVGVAAPVAKKAKKRITPQLLQQKEN